MNYKFIACAFLLLLVISILQSSVFATPMAQKTIVIYPIFTQTAYGNHAFYDYYKKLCNSTCLTVTIPKQLPKYTSSVGAVMILSGNNYNFISDIDVDKNPEILKKYDRIILLHNEYVTRKEFNAIISHPNVVYLYPNALYAEVKVDYNKNTISLVRGHGYPNLSLGNGFQWKYDNSKLEYDTACKNWIFYKIPNGSMLNCYPDLKILDDQSLLRALQE